MSKIITDKSLSYNDLTIMPARSSRVKSRSDIDIYSSFTHGLPIFASPMSTVTNEQNISFWENNAITPIIPRNIDLEIRKELMYKGKWVAFSLNEAHDIFIHDNIKTDNPLKICIDVANGHMKQLLDLCQCIKFKHKDNVSIMTGNIAYPEAILDYELYGVDFVRLSIGSGNGCLTAPQTGIHYPIASLIHECKTIKDKYNLSINLIADGGIRNYGDVIKALALGADYVMIGSLFASLFESAAKIEGEIGFVNDLDENEKRELLKSYKFEKVFYGMSTKKAQQLIKPDGEVLKTSEGVEKILDCTHTIQQWSENMQAYLRSAMSYCDCFNLDEFIGKQTLIVNSPSEINSVNK